jgi:cellobiose-specific phosphotransferase system component IIB
MPLNLFLIIKRRKDNASFPKKLRNKRVKLNTVSLTTINNQIKHLNITLIQPQRNRRFFLSHQQDIIRVY